MLGTLVKIKAQFTADTGKAQADVDRLRGKTDRAADAADRAESKFQRLGGVLKGVFGGAVLGGAVLLGRYVGNLASKAEDARIGLAAVFNVNKVSTFNKGLERSDKLIKMFNRSAKTSPGEGADFLNIFQRTAPVLAKFNPSNNSINDFASRSLGAAFAFNNGDVDLTADQISQILQGQGGADNKTFNALKGGLFSDLGITSQGSKATEEFNKIAASNPGRVYNALNRALVGLDEANEAFGKTFTGMMGSIKGTVNELLKNGFTPLFEKIKGGMSDAISYFEKHEYQIELLSKAVGEKLSGAFDKVKSSIMFVVDNMRVFLALAGGAAMKKALAMITASSIGGAGVGVGGMARNYATGVRGAGARAVGGARRGALGAASFAGDMLFGNMLGNGKSRGARIASAPGRALGALRAAPGAAKTSMFAALARNGGSIGAVAANGVAAGGKGAAAGIAKGARAMASFAASAAGLATVLLPLIVIGTMLYGAFRVLKDEGNEATQFLKLSWNELKIALDALAHQFGFSKSSGGFGGAVKKFLDWIGTGVVGVLGIGVKVVETFVNQFGALIVLFKTFGYVISDVIAQVQSGGVMSLTGDFIGDAFKRRFNEFNEERKQGIRNGYGDGADGGAKRAPMTPAQEKRLLLQAQRDKREEEYRDLAKNSPITVNVKNDIKVITEADPDKIAISLDKMNSSSINRAMRSVEGIPGM